MERKSFRILWFKEVTQHDEGLVGEKGAKLGGLAQAGFSIPEGFVVTSHAYFQFLRQNNLHSRISDLLSTVNFDRHDSVSQVSSIIKKMIMEANIPEDLVTEIYKSYAKLGKLFNHVPVAVRSSETSEDFGHSCFSGHHQAFLDVEGEANLILKVRESWASFFDPHPLTYRHQHNFDHFRMGLAVIVQKMVEADMSGSIFTIDPIFNDKNKIIIEAIYGLGELLKEGKVSPDRYEVIKDKMMVVYKSIEKQELMIKRVGKRDKEVKVPGKNVSNQKLTTNQILDLAVLGKKLERHFYFPQHVDWSIERNKILIVECKPIPVPPVQKEEGQTHERQLILKGKRCAGGTATGHVRILTSPKDVLKVTHGDIIVIPEITLSYSSAIKKAKAVIAERGGETSKVAIISRELSIPTIVGATHASKELKNGEAVTVNGTKGEVYKAPAPAMNEATLKTATKIYIPVSHPKLAESLAKENSDGVGILDGNQLIKNIGIHPKKILDDGEQISYIEKLSEQIEIVCKAFSPRPVIYKISDLTSDEYKKLEGGGHYERNEANPLIGMRGAFRHIHDHDVLNLEVRAIKNARDEKCHNLWTILPFVRSVKDLIEIKRLLSLSGLSRSPSFKIWMMVEIPATAIMIGDFINAGIDGVCVDTDNLTALLLGADPKNSEISSELNNLNPGALWAIEHVIRAANKHHIQSSACGIAPSIYPSLVEKLVFWGASSINIEHNTVNKVRRNVYDFEKKLVENLGRI